MDAGEMVDLMYVLCKDDTPSHLDFLVIVVRMLLLGFLQSDGPGGPRVCHGHQSGRSVNGCHRKAIATIVFSKSVNEYCGARSPELQNYEHLPFDKIQDHGQTSARSCRLH